VHRRHRRRVAGTEHPHPGVGIAARQPRRLTRPPCTNLRHGVSHLLQGHRQDSRHAADRPQQPDQHGPHPGDERVERRRWGRVQCWTPGLGQGERHPGGESDDNYQVQSVGGRSVPYARRLNQGARLVEPFRGPSRGPEPTLKSAPIRVVGRRYLSST
jgi:hypothetical protein